MVMSSVSNVASQVFRTLEIRKHLQWRKNLQEKKRDKKRNAPEESHLFRTLEIRLSQEVSVGED